MGSKLTFGAPVPNMAPQAPLTEPGRLPSHKQWAAVWKKQTHSIIPAADELCTHDCVFLHLDPFCKNFLKAILFFRDPLQRFYRPCTSVSPSEQTVCSIFPSSVRERGPFFPVRLVYSPVAPSHWSPFYPGCVAFSCPCGDLSSKSPFHSLLAGVGSGVCRLAGLLFHSVTTSLWASGDWSVTSSRNIIFKTN